MSKPNTLTLFILLFNSTLTLATTYSISFDQGDNGVRMPAAVFPSGNFLDSNGELVFQEGNSYIEHGFEHNAIVFNNQQFGSHVHAAGVVHADGSFSTGSQLAADAGGGFFRQVNGKQFSLDSWEIANLKTVDENELFNLNPNNFGPAPESHLVIQGSLAGVSKFTLDIFYTAAFLSTVVTPLGEVQAGTLDFLTVTNGVSTNIDLVEYWFSGTGRGVLPFSEHVQQQVVLENIVVTTVPVPAAFYLFLSALSGLMIVRKKALLG